MRIAILPALGFVLTSMASLAHAAEPEVPASITIKDQTPPRTGRATTVVTVGVVDELTVTYSPGSNVAIVETVKANGTNTILWRPKRPGVAEISAPGHESKRISIRFDGVPLSGVAIMLLAGLILFGGAFVSLRALLASD